MIKEILQQFKILFFSLLKMSQKEKKELTAVKYILYLLQVFQSSLVDSSQVQHPHRKLMVLNS